MQYMIAVLLLLSCLTVGCARPATGAALFWTSDDPTVREARALVDAGRFAEAEVVLKVSDKAALRADGLDVVRRIRCDYALDEAAMLAAVRKQVPDATREDLRQWRDAAQVRYRVIDGQTRYFKRAPSNLLRFCEEARSRRGGETVANELSPAKQQLHTYIRAALDEAEATSERKVAGLHHRVTYRITVKPGTEGVTQGARVRCWLPFPQDYQQQTRVRLIATTPANPRVAGDVPQRTVYLERRIEDPARPVVFEEVFEYDCYAYCPMIDAAEARTTLPAGMDVYLAERPPHIAFLPEIRGAVTKLVGDETNPLVKARRIWDYVDREIRWNAELEYGTIPCFVDKAMRTRRGDCGIQSMLFITMCRAAGVPARWQSGWITQPDDWNLHDWAEVYIEPWGWLPMDVSFGAQRSDDPAVRSFYFGHMDGYRMIVNTDYGRELAPRKRWLRSEPADFQRGEVELDGRNLYFDEWDWNITLEVTPINR